MTIAFVHGWGFGPEVWQDVLARLPGIEARCLDLGFFGPAEIALDGVTLAVGHSLGALWLLTERPDLPVIAVNGFSRFTATASSAPEVAAFPGVPPRLVERMQKRLGSAPQAVLDDFRVRCGAGPANAPARPERLAWGLDLLAQGDARPAQPIAALAGADDPIVPPAMAVALFPEARVLAGGHLLPLTAPDAVAALLREILESR